MSFSNILKKIKNIRILVIGDLILDHYIKGTAERISPEAPVPVVNVKDEKYVLGGAANVALNATILGAKTTLMGSIGKDSSGKLFQNLLGQNTIAFQALQNLAKTTLKTRIIAGNQQLCRIDYEECSASSSNTDKNLLKKISRDITQYDAIVISDYAKGVVGNDWVPPLIALAHKHKILIAIDPKPSREIDFSGIDLLTPNKIESFKLARVDAMSHSTYPQKTICKNIFERYRPKNLVVTLGQDGMLLSNQGKILKTIPTFAREVFDVCGAGDTVIASLSLALATGSTLEAASEFANTAAGIVVSKAGTATASPKEILEYQ